MTALLNLEALLLVLVLAICTATYVHQMAPGFIDARKDGSLGIVWKLARVGERLSPYISIFCAVMAVRMML